MNGSLKRKKAIYSKINFTAGLVAFAMALASLLLNIIAEFASIPTTTHLALAITFGSIGFVALIPLIISWAKLRKIQKELDAAENADNPAQ